MAFHGTVAEARIFGRQAPLIASSSVLSTNSQAQDFGQGVKLARLNESSGFMCKVTRRMPGAYTRTTSCLSPRSWAATAQVCPQPRTCSTQVRLPISKMSAAMPQSGQRFYELVFRFFGASGWFHKSYSNNRSAKYVTRKGRCSFLKKRTKKLLFLESRSLQ